MRNLLKKIWEFLGNKNVSIFLLEIYAIILNIFILKIVGMLNIMANQIGKIIKIIEVMSVKTEATSVQLTELTQKVDLIKESQNNFIQLINSFLVIVGILITCLTVSLVFKKK